MNATEPLLEETSEHRGRFQLYPILHPDIWEIREQGIQSFNWTVQAVSFVADEQHWPSLTEHERTLIKKTHAFFTAGDGLIGDPLMELYTKICPVEFKLTIMSMLANEGLHFEAYATVLEKFVTDTKERESLFKAYENSSSISAKIDWMKKWEKPDLAWRILQQICFEGIFFQASFCIIFWFKNRGKLPGITQLNDYISKDEGLHCKFWIITYKKLINKVKPMELKAMLLSAAEVEFAYVDDLMQEGELEGLTRIAVKTYVKFIVNYWARELDIGPIYQNARNPFGFMNNMGLAGKSNFFERRSTEYITQEDFGTPLTKKDFEEDPDNF